MSEAKEHLLVWKNLFEVFNERDSERRMEALKRLYAEDAVFYEGEETFSGLAAIGARFDAILSPTPAHFVFSVVLSPGRIRDLEQLAWRLGPQDAEPVASGLDIALVKDEKIQELYTFVDEVAAG